MIVRRTYSYIVIQNLLKKLKEMRIFRIISEILVFKLITVYKRGEKYLSFSNKFFKD